MALYLFYAGNGSITVNYYIYRRSVRDSLVDTSVVAGGHEQLVPYEVQDQELAFVKSSAEVSVVRTGV
jgi:hypothetical protein